MLTIAGVEHRHARPYVLCKEIGATTVLVADNEHVDLHRFQVLQRIEQGFTLGCRRSVDVQAQNIG